MEGVSRQGTFEGHKRTSLSARTNCAYSPDASILLVGIRGTGRSTLALVASTSLRFNLVDSEKIFHAKHGQTRTAYVAAHGSDEYRRQEVELLRSILTQHPKRAVIICGSGSVEGSGQELVRNFATSHPVIFILRDAGDISRYLGSCDEDFVSDLVHRSTPTFRTLSNLEFYNLSDSAIAMHGKDQAGQPSLLLKNVERDFLQLCSSAREHRPGVYTNKAQHSLSAVPLERRFFTYCLSLPIELALKFAEQTRGVDILVDAIELTIDIAPLCSANSLSHSIATQITRQYFVTRRSFQLPIIIHVISSMERGLQDLLAREIYLEVVAHALRLAPDYLTVDFHLDDADISQVRSARGHTRIIGHYLETSPSSNYWSSPQIWSLLQRMRRSQCDLIRLCQTATSRADNQGVREFIHSAKSSEKTDAPIIAYNTGRHGRQSCYLNQILTPVTHPLLRNPAQIGGDDRSWLLTIQESQSALYSSYTFEPQFFGILGADVLASLSPAMHNCAFESFQLPHKYSTLQCSSLKDLKTLVHDTRFGGASITSPFKQEIIPVLDHLSQSARAIGAVNTLIPLRSNGLDGLLARNETGPAVALYGDNTDWIGIYNCVRRHLSPVNAIRTNTTALVIGAGGMAHACVYSMIRLGIRAVFVCNRTEKRAQELACRFNGKTYSIDHNNVDNLIAGAAPDAPMCGPADVRVLPPTHSPWPTGFAPPTVIVSCVRSAAPDGPEDLDVPDEWLANQTGGVLIELSYDSLETKFIRKARTFSSRGWITVHGLQVLPEQGIAQFELFTGRRAPENVMRAQMTQRYTQLA
ncbi:unnamed protein product [Periconia digitata]|uniref:Quinate repressor protein n=1 Tax=Periconia digitata TaxID=1303443 RepID=A0A9W4U8T1_9PLEO|nr:unnamed protein product [Periconia digitata]